MLFGKANPSGHLPVTFPKNLSQVPASTPQQFPGVNANVQCSEGLDIGYRWYDARNITPLFPFGNGLSYTSFRYSNLQVQAPSQAGADVRVTATVTNTGSRAGADGRPAAPAGLPLQGSFTLASTPGARQVSLSVPATMTPGSPSTVTVNLSAGGTETLPHAKLTLQLPQGWHAWAKGRITQFKDVPARHRAHGDVQGDSARGLAEHQRDGSRHREAGPRPHP